MGKRRFAQADPSDEEEESRSGDGRQADRKMQRKRVEFVESSAPVLDQDCRGKKRDDGPEEREDGNGDARPVGCVLGISGKGTEMKKYYAAFEYDGNTYELEDSVLLTPEQECEKPFVVIIKEITQIPTGNVMVNGQWLYRPEEAMEKCGGNWLTVDSRELFYSLHLDEFPAESVMHKCIVHFVPPHKQIPSSMEHPGFVVQKVYDDINQKLWKITDKGHADGSQREIDRLIKKTQEHLGELPDRDNDLKKKSDIINKQMLQIDVSDGDNDVTRSPIQSKAKDASNLCLILKQCRVCTGDRYRDMWLEKLLQAIQFVCQLDPMLVEDSDKRKDSTRKTMTISGVISESDKMISNASEHIVWPDDAVLAVAALEKTVHEALCSDFRKYNQKMRQLVYNLKRNILLANRLLKKELKPSVLLSMSPSELKDGLLADKKDTQKPEQSRHVKMTDAQCSRCLEQNAGVVDIINAGGCGERYQLECTGCGRTWYAPADEVSTLTADAPPSAAGDPGAKFDVIEKKPIGPRVPEEPRPQRSSPSSRVNGAQRSPRRRKTEATQASPL